MESGNEENNSEMIINYTIISIIMCT